MTMLSDSSDAAMSVSLTTLPRRIRRSTSFMLLFMLATAFSHSATLFESPARGVPLIELFTSEGCNSCPEADAWLSSLASNDGLWSEFVPVAFHVTYWDSLGWSDRFAQAAFDSLHTSTAARAGTAVYTPGVFVEGEEWRSWRRAPRGYSELPEDAPVY